MSPVYCHGVSLYSCSMAASQITLGAQLSSFAIWSYLLVYGLCACLQQVHMAVADPQFLRDFHAASDETRSVHADPWAPPAFNAEAGFAKQRRMLYTTSALLEGLPHLPGAGWVHAALPVSAALEQKPTGNAAI